MCPARPLHGCSHSLRVPCRCLHHAFYDVPDALVGLHSADARLRFACPVPDSAGDPGPVPRHQRGLPARQPRGRPAESRSLVCYPCDFGVRAAVATCCRCHLMLLRFCLDCCSRCVHWCALELPVWRHSSAFRSSAQPCLCCVAGCAQNTTAIVITFTALLSFMLLVIYVSIDIVRKGAFGACLVCRQWLLRCLLELVPAIRDGCLCPPFAPPGCSLRPVARMRLGRPLTARPSFPGLSSAFALPLHVRSQAGRDSRLVPHPVLHINGRVLRRHLLPHLPLRGYVPVESAPLSVACLGVSSISCDLRLSGSQRECLRSSPCCCCRLLDLRRFHPNSIGLELIASRCLFCAVLLSRLQASPRSSSCR